MITIWKKRENTLEELETAVPGSWIHAVSPTAEEERMLRDDVGVPASFLSSAMDPDERPRTDRENGLTLIVMQVPYYCGEGSDIPYRTAPFTIILMADYVVTICRVRTGVVERLVHTRGHMVSTGKHNRLVLQMLWMNASTFLAYLSELNAKIDAAEDRLEKSLRNQEVLELLRYRKSLVYFTTALKSNDLMMRRLERSHLFEAYPEDLELLDDVQTENNQAMELTGIASSILSGMMDAFASIISNNLNTVVKILTSVTIILSFPALVAALFGMNVALPLGDSEAAFVWIMLGSAVISAVVALVFWRKDWL